MVQAKRPSTHKQYTGYISAWFKHCTSKSVNPYVSSIPQVLTFLEELRSTRNLGYNALNTARSALSSILDQHNNVPVGQHPLLKTYMRAAFNICPPLPRYTDTWDPEQVLTLLRQWAPPADISLKLLTLKVAMLILLVSGQRLQTLTLLDIRNMTVTSSEITFRIVDLLKQSRPGYRNPLVSLQAFLADDSICVFSYLNEYVSRTAPLRGQVTSLFITFKKPHAKASKDSVSRWIKTVMKEAGLNTQLYRPHSVRSASSSAASRGGAPIQDILDTAGWASSSVFGKFYKKPLALCSSYSSAVLGNKSS